MIRSRDVQVDLNETFDTTPDTIKAGAVKYRVIFTLFKRIGLDTCERCDKDKLFLLNVDIKKTRAPAYSLKSI